MIEGGTEKEKKEARPKSTPRESSSKTSQKKEQQRPRSEEPVRHRGPIPAWPKGQASAQDWEQATAGTEAQRAPHQGFNFEGGIDEGDMSPTKKSKVKHGRATPPRHKLPILFF